MKIILQEKEIKEAISIYLVEKQLVNRGSMDDADMYLNDTLQSFALTVDHNSEFVIELEE